MYAIYTLALTLIYTDAAISTGKSMFCLPFKTNVKKVFFKMAAVNFFISVHAISLALI